MNRKEFLITSAKAGVGLLAGSHLSSCMASDPAKESTLLPKYWLWMRPSVKNSDDEWKRIFLEIREMGIEAVLPEVYSSNMALFDTGDFQTKELLLERMIPLAHEAGLQLHAWMWTMPCNHPQILKDHPDWYAVNRSGQRADQDPAYVPYYKFLCPRHPEVRQFIKKRVDALASISDLDGIHLDYVRLPDVILAEGLQPNYNIVQDKEYPQYDYCYCPTCREAYISKTGIDPLDIEDPENDKDWYQFRYDAVKDLVNDHLVPSAKAKNKTITAAVFPNWESVRQQWHEFDLDAFLPMLYQGFYNEDIPWIGNQTEDALRRLNHTKPIFSGLYLPHLKEKGMIAEAVESAMHGGSSGFSLFSYGDLKGQQKQEVKLIIDSLRTKTSK